MNDTRESCRKLPLKAVLVAEFKNKRGGEQEGWDCLVVVEDIRIITLKSEWI
jgi:hypothetical protein